jgi:hypothetical protein
LKRYCRWWPSCLIQNRTKNADTVADGLLFADQSIRCSRIRLLLGLLPLPRHLARFVAIEAEELCRSGSIAKARIVVNAFAACEKTTVLKSIVKPSKSSEEFASIARTHYTKTPNPWLDKSDGLTATPSNRF